MVLLYDIIQIFHLTFGQLELKALLLLRCLIPSLFKYQLIQHLILVPTVSVHLHKLALHFNENLKTQSAAINVE